MIRAVIFDVGGPLDLETAAEAAIDADILQGLAQEGIPVNDTRFKEAGRFAVRMFAPNAYKAIIWYLAQPDVELCERVYKFVEEQGHARNVFELRPGMAELLASLKKRGLKLGLAANRPVEAIDRLKLNGIGDYFDNQGVAGQYGFRKPDVRLFLRACEDLGVEPAECIMVGDRIDNDVAPAKLVGMRTILLRTGRHRNQQPREWGDLPDATVEDVPSLAKAIDSLLAYEAR